MGRIIRFHSGNFREVIRTGLKQISNRKKDYRIPRKILVIKPSSLGDVVHSLPFLNAMKTCFPRSEIHWVIARGLEGLLEGHPMIDNLIVIDKDTWKKISRTGQTIREVRSLFRRLRREKYDMAIDLQGLLRSGMISMATGAAVRIGFSEAREGSRFFYNRKVKGGKDRHAVDRYLAVASALGCEISPVLFPFPLIGDEPANISALKKELGEYCVMVPGARWDTKQWLPEHFGEVAARLPIKSVIIGGKDDIPLAERITALAGGKAVSLAGLTSIRELVSVIRDALFMISNDSGPLHIGAACHIPVCAVFGPTSPRRTGPYGRGHIIIKSPLECSPCFKKKCPEVKCMKGITAGEVYEKIISLFQHRWQSS